MTLRSVATAAVSAVQRQWWIVAVVVLAAAIAGYVLAMDEETTYSARATLQVDSSILARVSGLPGPERLLKAVGARDFRSEIASRTGVDEATLETAMRAYIVGSPAESFVVEFSGTDETVARQVADAAAIATVEEVKRLGATELERQALNISETKALLQSLESLRVTTDWERADIEFRRWQARRDLADLEALNSRYSRAYVYEGNVVVSKKSASSKQLEAVTGAALIGMVSGLALAALREHQYLRGVHG